MGYYIVLSSYGPSGVGNTIAFVAVDAWCLNIWVISVWNISSCLYSISFAGIVWYIQRGLLSGNPLQGYRNWDNAQYLTKGRGKKFGKSKTLVKSSKSSSKAHYKFKSSSTVFYAYYLQISESLVTVISLFDIISVFSSLGYFLSSSNLVQLMSLKSS